MKRNINIGAGAQFPMDPAGDGAFASFRRSPAADNKVQYSVAFVYASPPYFNASAWKAYQRTGKQTEPGSAMEWDEVYGTIIFGDMMEEISARQIFGELSRVKYDR